MPTFQPLHARHVGPLADATRRAGAAEAAGDVRGAAAILGAALVQARGGPDPCPALAVMRLAFLYRRLKQYAEEADLLERSLPHQTDESDRRRVHVRLTKARSLAARTGSQGTPVAKSAPLQAAPRAARAPDFAVGQQWMSAMADREIRRKATHDVRADFVRAELAIAGTMLDLVASSRDADARVRRLERARVPAAEVMRCLAHEGAPFDWTDHEHEAFSRTLWSLSRRLRSGMPPRDPSDLFSASALRADESR